VFLLGRTTDVKLQEKVEQEAKEYGDIVMMDYQDSYKNLVYKAIFAFRFFKDFCRSDVIAIKGDDDIFYDIFIITEKFKIKSDMDRYVACPVWQENTMPILRDPKTCAKWCIRKDELVGRTGYPRYCSGWLWIFSLNFVDDMLAAINRTHFLVVEDAFLTGILMGQVKGLEYRDILSETPIYATPRVHGTVHLRWQYQNATKPNKYLLTDIANTETMYEMYDLSVKSLFLKKSPILQYLDFEALKESVHNKTGFPDSMPSL
jgi:beta-1,3-galactosyltransferase 1